MLVSLSKRGTTVAHETEGPRERTAAGLFCVPSAGEQRELVRMLDIVRAAAESPSHGGNWSISPPGFHTAPIT